MQIGSRILCAIDVEKSTGVGYFATFLMAAGAYVPSCLVQSWQNNNNLNETSRAATTGLLVGLGNFMAMLTFYLAHWVLIKDERTTRTSSRYPKTCSSPKDQKMPPNPQQRSKPSCPRKKNKP